MRLVLSTHWLRRRILSGALLGAWAFIACVPLIGAVSVSEVSFIDRIFIYRDDINAAPLITNPAWTAGGKREPVAYAGGTKMNATVTFKIDPIPANEEKVTITGEVDGAPKLVKKDVTIPKAATLEVQELIAVDALPKQTKFFNPMTITWSYQTAGGQNIPIGQTTHQVYVTLDKPLPGAVAYLTTLVLAVEKDGAADAPTAFANTWSRFAGPADVEDWEGFPLYYYKPGVGFGSCATTELSLLISRNRSGQCGSFARLLINALGLNRIESEFVTVSTKDGNEFLVRDWMFGPPSYKPPLAYLYKIVFNMMAIDHHDRMVPKQPGNVYGDLTSLNTLAGQNTMPPSEKVFIRHFIVKFAAAAGDKYFDPSYGVTYADATSFEKKAVDGYMRHFAEDAVNQFRVRRPVEVNIRFNK